MAENLSESKKSMSDERASGNFAHNMVVGILGVLTLVTLFMVSQLDGRLNTVAAKLDTTASTLDKKISVTDSAAANAKEVNEMLADELSKQSKQTQKSIAGRMAQLRKEQVAA